MPELILRLRVDPATGRREVVVDYASDADALPIEHEEEHRRLAAGVVEDGLTSPRVDVRRDAEPRPAAGATDAAAEPAQDTADVAAPPARTGA